MERKQRRVRPRPAPTRARLLGLSTCIAWLLVLAQPAAAGSSASIGLDYWSDYFWRGFSFYGDASSPRGVFFPWVGASWKQLSLTVAGELPQSLLGGSPNTTEEAWGGVDFILSTSTTLLDDQLSVGGRTAYFLYPNSPNVNADGDRNDFVEIGAWLRLDRVPLTPKLEYSQYFRIDDHAGQQVANRDIYLRFSVEHRFEPLEHLLLTTRGSIAYFWYPSSRIGNTSRVLSSMADKSAL